MNAAAHLIDSHRSQILDRLTRQATPASSKDPLEHGALQPLDRFISQLCRQLEGVPLDPDEWTQEYAEQRMNAGFGIDDVNRELFALEEAVSSALEEDPPPTVRDLATVFRLVREAVNAARRSYTRQLLARAQEQARLTRTLDSAIVAHANAGGGIQETLREPLELVRRFVGCDCLVLLEKREDGARLVVGDDPAAVAGADREALSALAAAAQPQASIWRVPRPDGSPAYAWVVGLVIADQTLGALVAFWRRTEVPSERERSDLLAVAQRISCHLTHLHNEELLQRGLDLRSVELDAVEQGIAMIAHDLRSPLLAARGFVQLLDRHRELIRERPMMLERVLRNIDRADRMIQNLLDVRQAASGRRASVILAHCNLTHVVGQLVEELQAEFGPRIVFRGELPVLGRFDSESLRRAVWNLCVNAVKYGALDGPVTISLESLVDGARLCVHNEGPAIPEGARAALFAPFDRGTTTMSAGRRGWGLGLAAVKACVDAHGGTIEVRSVPDEGTSFILRLPSAASDAA